MKKEKKRKRNWGICPYFYACTDLNIFECKIGSLSKKKKCQRSGKIKPISLGKCVGYHYKTKVRRKTKKEEESNESN